MWQYFIGAYLITVTIPQCVVFLCGPGLLHRNVIPFWQFFLSIFLPGPFALYWVVLIFYGRPKSCPILKKIDNSRQSQFIAKSEILNETFHLYDSEQLPRLFSWGGIAEFHRLGLVLCSHFISNSVTKILSMSTISFLMTIFMTLIKPFKDSWMNSVAIMSIASQPIIGFINLIFSVVYLFETEIHSFAFHTFNILYGLEEFLTFLLPFLILIIFLGKLFSLDTTTSD